MLHRLSSLIIILIFCNTIVFEYIILTHAFIVYYMKLKKYANSFFFQYLFLNFASRIDNTKNKKNIMRLRTSTWFETKVSLQKMQEDGTEKMVTEPYVVDALSFTEAENSIIEEVSAYTSGDLKILDIKPAAYSEIYFSDLDNDDKWYKAKLQFITIDEKTEKEKKTSHTYLLQANSLPRAVKYVEEMMRDSMSDYTISNIQETRILDVFEHHSPDDKKKAAKDDVPEYLEGEPAPAE